MTIGQGAAASSCQSAAVKPTPTAKCEPGAEMGFGLKRRLVHGCTLAGGWRAGG